MKSSANESKAEAVFIEYLEAQETGASSFDEFCDAHPALEAELRRIYGAWEWASGLLGDESEPPDVSPSVRDDFAGERYSIRGEVARGGMGIVLEAFDRTLRRKVAMKVLRPEARERKRTIARFLEEAQITGQLEHPSIVPIYDAGETQDGDLFYTMPLIRGRELGELFELAREGREGWTLVRALDILLRVCEAVGAAHARGVIHRDLKPSNVMVGLHGEVHVMDWGLARIAGSTRGLEGSSSARAAPQAGDVHSARQDEIRTRSDSSLVTLDGQVLGTPSYMSPEQARGKKDVDCTTDVYSAGAILRLLLVGRRPFAESDANPNTDTVLDRLVAGPPPPLTKLAPRAAPELVAICERAMARNPHERYVDMGELASDLRAFREQRVVSAYRTGALPELAHWIKRNPALSLAMSIALVSLIAGLLGSLALKRNADHQADVADRHFESALDAVDRMLTEVGARELETVPGFQPVRRRLLEDARDFYAGFLAERGNDVAVQRRVARAHMRLASVHTLLGQYPLALEEQALGIARLTQRPARQLVDTVALAEALLEQSRILQSVGDLAEARRALDRCLAELEPAALEHPRDPRLRFIRAHAMSSIGNLLLEQRDPDARDWLEKSFEANTALYSELADGRTRDDATSSLAKTCSLLGVLRIRASDYDQAQQHFERALALREELYARTESLSAAANLVGTLSNLAGAIGSKNPGDPATDPLTLRILELSRILQTGNPSVPHYTFGLLRSLILRSLTFSGRGEFEKALPLLEEALSVWEKAPPHTRSSYEAYSLIEGLYYPYAWALTELGRFAEVEARVRANPPLDEAGTEAELRIRAQVWAFCLQGALRSDDLSDAERAPIERRLVRELVPVLERLREIRGPIPLFGAGGFGELRAHPQLAELMKTLSLKEES